MMFGRHEAERVGIQLKLSAREGSAKFVQDQGKKRRKKHREKAQAAMNADVVLPAGQPPSSSSSSYFGDDFGQKTST
jgi:hypothetical protein